MLRITHNIAIRDEELVFTFVRASGPGGQNVNKVATAAQLRFDAADSPSLSAPLKRRVLELAGSRATAAGLVIIEAKRFRTQERNRQDALARLGELIRRAARPQRPRRPTKPTTGSKERRLTSKRNRARLKQDRRPPPPD